MAVTVRRMNRTDRLYAGMPAETVRRTETDEPVIPTPMPDLRNLLGRPVEALLLGDRSPAAEQRPAA